MEKGALLHPQPTRRSARKGHLTGFILKKMTVLPPCNNCTGPFKDCTAVIWLKYCRYGVKHSPINRVTTARDMFQQLYIKAKGPRCLYNSEYNKERQKLSVISLEKPHIVRYIVATQKGTL